MNHILVGTKPRKRSLSLLEKLLIPDIFRDHVAKTFITCVFDCLFTEINMVLWLIYSQQNPPAPIMLITCEISYKIQ